MHISGPRVCLQLKVYIYHALKFDLWFQLVCGMWLSQQRSQNELQLDDMEVRVKGVNIRANGIVQETEMNSE